MRIIPRKQIQYFSKTYRREYALRVIDWGTRPVERQRSIGLVISTGQGSSQNV